MKPFFFTLAAILMAVTSYAQSSQNLERLWRSYEQTEKEDKPKESLAVLDKIKAEALKSRSDWDYFRACDTFRNVRLRINWKDRDEADSAFEKEIDSCSDPVVAFYYRKYRRYQSREELMRFACENRRRLETGHNKEFYANDSSIEGAIFSKALLPLIENDWQYVVWSLFLGGMDLKEEIGGFASEKYPLNAFADYSLAMSGDDMVSALDTFVRKYSGNAASLLGRDRLLSIRFGELLKSVSKSSEPEFKTLRAECAALIRDRKTWSGSEKLIADCCTEADRIAGTLDAQSISVCNSSFENITLQLTNLQELGFALSSQGKKLLDRRLKNPEGSYFVPDTLLLDIPALDDGEYDAEFSYGGKKEKATYSRYSLSLAIREDAGGFSVYVADSRSGRPVESCSIELHAGDILKDSAADLRLDGFTPLPASISEALSQSRGLLSIRAVCKGENGLMRRSRLQSVYSSYAHRNAFERKANNVLILTDRRALNPSDTLKFKVIAYDGIYEHSLRPSGVRLRAVLSDAAGKEVGNCELETGSFGSAAGSFLIESGHRNGNWRLSVYEGTALLGSQYIRVDEFVLPTFHLAWEEDRQLHLTGDEITLSGRIRSYSSHSLSSAVITPSVNGPDLKGEPRFEMQEDGRFTLSFKAGDSEYGCSYNVNVRITDASGQTLEFSNHVWAQPSIPLYPVLLNAAEASFALKSSTYREMGVVSSDSAVVELSLGSLVRDGLKVKYTLTRDRALVCCGEADAASSVRLDLSDQPSGLYVFEACACEGGRKTEFKGCFIKASDDDDSLDADISWFFKDTEGDGISVQAGSTDGPVWIVAELFDASRHLLSHRIVYLSGEKASSGSLRKISFTRPNPDALVLKLFFFKDGESSEYCRVFEALPVENTLPLTFSRFLDTTLPGADYTFTLRTSPDVECAAAVFDISTETIAANHWPHIAPAVRMPEVPYCSSSCGGASCYLAMAPGLMRNKALMSAGRNEAMLYSDDSVAEQAAMVEESDAVQGAGGMEPRIRRNFSSAAAWEPFLRSDKDGNVSFSFTNSDRLSTYAVQVFAHDHDFKNATLRGEMVVTLPVKVSLVEPRVLREGDSYVVRVSLANSTGKDITGCCSVAWCKGTDKDAPLGVSEGEVTVPAGGSAVFCSSAIDVRDIPGGLGLLVSFKSESAGDAVFVLSEVKPSVQTLTEAHSSLLRSGDDRQALIESLRSQFVNVDGSAASVREISVLDMLKEAVPEKVEPLSDDVLSLSEAYYANLLARKLGAPGCSDEQLSALLGRILECRNPDGGYSWFKGMRSSPIITAVLLQRLARMSSLDSSLSGKFFQNDAVLYLDRTFSKGTGPDWNGSVSLEEYLHVRSMYPEVEFDTKNFSSKELKQLRKGVKAYLVPSRERGLNGRIFAKARRLSTLKNLLENGQGLSKQWGIRLTSSLKKSVEADTRSLVQYAVEHQSGGFYFPNVVVPWQGLLEGELYAHVVLCDLLTDCQDVSEGIRLWMMVQKETQSWGSDPAFLEALACVNDADARTLETKVIALSAEYCSAFEDIRPSGNGFTLDLKYFHEDGSPLADGDTLEIGEKIRAEYHIWNGEIRSFVRLNVPRPASLTPVRQLSGLYSWYGNPLGANRSVRVVPQGYRSVGADCTQYWFDTYPEENTVIQEEFFVSQSGRYHSPVPQIESLYAPHYRANGESQPLESR